MKKLCVRLVPLLRGFITTTSHRAQRSSQNRRLERANTVLSAAKVMAPIFGDSRVIITLIIGKKEKQSTASNMLICCSSSINTDNDISLEIRRRITLANRCSFGLRKQQRKKALSWRTKICLYKVVKKVLRYFRKLVSASAQFQLYSSHRFTLELFGKLFSRANMRLIYCCLFLVVRELQRRKHGAK